MLIKQTDLILVV